MSESIIIKFSSKVQFEEELPNIDEMTIDGLKEYRDALVRKIEQLDFIEPEDEATEDYDNWADKHEELEDIRDEVNDRLDELLG